MARNKQNDGQRGKRTLDICRQDWCLQSSRYLSSHWAYIATWGQKKLLAVSLWLIRDIITVVKPIVSSKRRQIQYTSVHLTAANSVRLSKHCVRQVNKSFSWQTTSLTIWDLSWVKHSVKTGRTTLIFAWPIVASLYSSIRRHLSMNYKETRMLSLRSFH